MATPKPTISETIQEGITDENFKIKPKDFKIKELKGNFNNSWVQLGGVLRKQLNPNNVKYVLHVLNKHLLEGHIPSNEIEGMCRELEKYDLFDEQALAERVLQYIKEAEGATKTDVERALEEKKIVVDKILAYLRREGYIVQKGRYYKPIQKVEWQTNFTDFGKKLSFKVPYFDKYATFRHGDCIVIGAKTGTGKTHQAMNIIKKLIAQGVVANYIPSEGGGRFSVISQQLGLKEGDFRFPKKEKSSRTRPEDIELEDNAVTIIDWLLPGDYATTDKIFERFDQQLEVHGGLLIVFVQLNSDGRFYANEMMKFFPSWVCKFLYEDDKDRTASYFETDKIREGTYGRTYAKIPCIYDPKTKLLTSVEEMEEDEKEDE